MPANPLLSPSAVLYTDAAGDGCLGVVLFTGKEGRAWSSTRIPSGVTSLLNPRLTQIILYEAIAVAVGLFQFTSTIKSHRLIVLVDNQTALGAFVNGYSPISDLNAVSSFLWSLAEEAGVTLYFRWVPSPLNFADLPSRRRPVPAAARVNVAQFPWGRLSALLVPEKGYVSRAARSPRSLPVSLGSPVSPGAKISLFSSSSPLGASYSHRLPSLASLLHPTAADDLASPPPIRLAPC